MLSFFVKCIIVKEKIKVDDKYLSDDNSLILTRQLHPSVDDSFFENKKKVKLCLCSRDIQIGDKMVFECLTDGNYEEFQIDTINDIFPDMIKKGTQFKVIGEISPEATWVKEGDEFVEKELRFPYEGNFIKILGPCKHFH